MPELPDVERRRKYLISTSLGQPIKKVEVFETSILRDISPRKLNQSLVGSSFTQVKRRAKYLLLLTDKGGTLLMHLGMTGDVKYQEAGEEVARPVKTFYGPRFARAAFYFNNGRVLYYISQRKLSKISFFNTQDLERIPDIKKLGPEPLSENFTLEEFEKRITRHKTEIHKTLMMQNEIGGIGNVYADEIGFQAGVRPERSSNKLTKTELKNLYTQMRKVLKEAVEVNAEVDRLKDSFIIPHRHGDKKCPRCGENLGSKKIGDRTSYFCPCCQR